MADFIRKKLQVFVSSTYTDLITERQAAVSAILSAGHIPAGMELFTAGDESQMDVIKQWIDESDVFMLILGGRYGSLEPMSGKSYTHLEYEYAASQNKPLFACVIQEAAIERRVKSDGTAVIEITNAAKLSDFRTHVLGKLCKFWEDAKDIKIAVTETLAHIARREDLSGWVRPSGQTDLASLLEEMTRLSKENASLRVAVQSRARDKQINGLSFEALKSLLIKSRALETLMTYRHQLVSVRGVSSIRSADARLSELAGRGLIALDGAQYRLTETGRTFLNMMDYEATLVPTPEIDAAGQDLQNE